MKRGLARSLACLGSLLHGLYYQPWNTTTAKLCVCARVFGLRELGRNKCFSSSEQDFLAGFRRTRRKNSIWRPLPESARGIWWLPLPRGHLGMPMVGVHILGMTPGDSKREEKKPAHLGDEWVGAGAAIQAVLVSGSDWLPCSSGLCDFPGRPGAHGRLLLPPAYSEHVPPYRVPRSRLWPWPRRRRRRYPLHLSSVPSRAVGEQAALSIRRVLSFPMLVSATLSAPPGPGSGQHAAS